MKTSRFGFASRTMEQWNLGGKDSRLDGGINTADLPYTLDGNQSPEMRNLWFQNGSLTKRWGQTVFFTAEDAEPIKTVFSDGDGFVYFQAGRGLYRLTIADKSCVCLAQLDEDAPIGRFVRSGADILYFNGVVYLILREGDWEFTAIEAYVPTVFIGCDPSSGEGNVHEDFNLLSEDYKISYNAVSGTTFLIPAQLPVDTVIRATVDSVEAAFTYSQANRTVTFTNAPTAGYDNVVLTVRAERIARRADVLGCTCGVIYGGDSRMILGGNGTNEIFCSAAYDPTFFPESTALRVGNGEAITGFGMQYDFLAVFKAHEIAYVNYRYTSEKTVLSANVLNPSIGCDMPGSICNIGNRIIFANTENGICVITSTSRENERNILFISRNIDSLLFEESMEARKAACGYVFDGRYWLSVGEHVFLWDHSAQPLRSVGGEENMRQLAWYYFDNIPAAAFFSYGRQLYYCRREGDSHGGAIVRFEENYHDFGAPIEAYWRSALFDFDRPNWYKYIDRIWLIFHGRNDSAATIRYIYSEKDRTFTITDRRDITYGRFSWASFDWRQFSWEIPGVLKSMIRYIRRRRVVFFSIELSNNEVGRDMALSDIIIQYSYEHKIK